MYLYWPIREGVGVSFTEGGANTTIIPSTSIEVPYAWEWYFALIDEMESFGSNTYTVESATPSGSSRMENGGIRIIRETGSATWGLTDLSDGPATHLLGAIDAAEGDHDQLTSPHTRGGMWQDPPYSQGTIDGDIASETHRNAMQGLEGAVATRWEEMDIRILEWAWVPAAHVRRGLATRSAYADAAGLATGDLGNCWSDLWQYGIGAYERIARVGAPNIWPASLEHDPGAHPWEAVFSRRDSDYAERLSESINQTDESAHVYRIEVGFGIDEQSGSLEGVI